MKLRCLESDDRFALTAEKTYKVNGEPDSDGEDTYVSIFNDNMRSVRVKLAQFEEIVDSKSILEKISILAERPCYIEATNENSFDFHSKNLAIAIDNAIGWLENYHSGTDDECDARKAAEDLKMALGFQIEK